MWVRWAIMRAMRQENGRKRAEVCRSGKRCVRDYRTLVTTVVVVVMRLTSEGLAKTGGPIVSSYRSKDEMLGQARVCSTKSCKVASVYPILLYPNLLRSGVFVSLKAEKGGR